ncbi:MULTISPECIES: hypothetical protein [Actinosynnema]|uniref:hypothetical protein n=1 Tax=Actinosynnema TaxID=40566 RepID=UPI0020A2F8BE|nr:hypothetical protein [Actinosynnema pretiosum]MCP2098185.1 hypothetical protein [Actinosynnema pretiosum]
MRTARRLTSLLAAIAVVAAPVVTTGVAHAADNLPTHTTYGGVHHNTDSLAPDTVDQGGDPRTGARVDEQGRTRTGKAYFTFDLSRLTDATAHSAVLGYAERDVADCSAATALEVWDVDVTGPITWADQPAEVRALPAEPRTACPDHAAEADVVDAVNRALAQDRSTLTLALRVPEQHATDPAHGRTLHTWPSLRITYNTPIEPVAEIRFDEQQLTCGPTPLSARLRYETKVTAKVSDPDISRGQEITTTFAVWPLDAPEQRQEQVRRGTYTGRFTATYPQGAFEDGRAYGLAVRATDGHTTTPWSPTCEFANDLTAPVAPQVTSTDYPENGPAPVLGQGVPGLFAFDANGSADVVAFEHSGSGIPTGAVRADRPGGSATALIAPAASGAVHLQVVSLDRAGNRSAARTYVFLVVDTRPVVAAPQSTEVGEPFEVRITAVQPGAVALRHAVGQGAPTTVPITRGETATVTVVLGSHVPGGFHRLRVWTTDAAGNESGTAQVSVLVEPHQPTITITPRVGTPGQVTTFEFRTDQPGAVRVQYELEDGPTGTADVVNGLATAGWTPQQPGTEWLRARTATAAGAWSAWSEYHAVRTD